WNRLHRCLFLQVDAGGQEYGPDSLDSQPRSDTTYLLAGESHTRGLACLDEFLQSKAYDKVTDARKRAVFQRDLWALFDRSARSTDHQSSRGELQRRLAEALRHLALTQEQIRALPDTYAQAIQGKAFAEQYDPGNPARPFLPDELFKADSPWV